MNTNHESVAYRSFSPSKFEARGARKVTTGISQLSLERRCCSIATKKQPKTLVLGVASGSGNVYRGLTPIKPSRGDRGFPLGTETLGKMRGSLSLDDDHWYELFLPERVPVI